MKKIKKTINLFFQKMLNILLVVGMLGQTFAPALVFAVGEEDTTTPDKGEVIINDSVTTTNEAGNVKVVKKVSEKNPGSGDGKYTVTFEITGEDTSESQDKTVPIYVVVVFDRSNSMTCSNPTSSCTDKPEKLSEAKQAAIDFSEKLLAKTDNEAQLALVTFAGRSSVARNFDNTPFTEPLFGNRASSTNIQGGLKDAYNLLNDVPEADAKKYIVLMSDGEPTETSCGRNECGSSRNNVDRTIYYANNTVKPSGIEIFSIGYYVSGIQNAIKTLKGVASENLDTDLIKHYVEASSTTDISGAFDNVVGSIDVPVKAGTIKNLKDIISDEFKVTTAPDELKSQGIEVDENGNITFTPTDENKTLTKDGVSFTFDIELKDKTIASGDYATNGGYTLDYVDGKAQEQSIHTDESAKIHWEQMAKYKVKYYKESFDGNTISREYLGESNEFLADVGQVISSLDNDVLNAKKPENYQDGIIEQPITIVVGENTINVIYRPISDQYKVEYYYDNVHDNNNDETLTVNYGEVPEYVKDATNLEDNQYTDKTKDGYTQTYVRREITGKTIKLYYEKLPSIVEGSESLEKIATSKIYDKTEKIIYQLNYTVSVNDISGKYTLVISDELPYNGTVTFVNAIDKESCQVTGKNIKCTYNDVKIDTTSNNPVTIKKTIPYEVVYNDPTFDVKEVEKITNKASSTLTLIDEKHDYSIDSTKNAQADTDTYGKLEVTHNYDGTISKEAEKEGQVKTSFEATKKEENGYILSSISISLADGTIRSATEEELATGIVEGKYILGTTKVIFNYVLRSDLEYTVEYYVKEVGKDTYSLLNSNLVENVTYGTAAIYSKAIKGYTFSHATLTDEDVTNEVIEGNGVDKKVVTITDNNNIIKVYFIEDETKIENDEFTKDTEISNEVITTDDNVVDYIINYEATLKNFIGNATVVITDKLPLGSKLITDLDAIEVAIINSLASEDKDSSKVNCEEKDGNLVCTIVYENIDTYKNGDKNIRISMPLTLEYENITDGSLISSITNNASIKLTLEDAKDGSKEEHDKEASKENDVLGTVVVKHVYGPQIQETYKENAKVGTSIPSQTKLEKEGYTFDKVTVSSNNDGVTFDSNGNLVTGSYVTGTTIITYEYKKDDIVIVDKEEGKGFIKEVQEDKVYDINEKLNYTITYNKVLDKHIGNYKLVISDKLPYTAKTITFNDNISANHCSLDATDNKTITCIYEVNDINTYKNGSLEIKANIPFTVEYEDMPRDVSNVKNDATANLTLEDAKDGIDNIVIIEKEKEKTNVVETKVFGKLDISHVYGEIVENETTKEAQVNNSWLAQKVEKDGYILDYVTLTLPNEEEITVPTENGTLEGIYLAGVTKVVFNYKLRTDLSYNVEYYVKRAADTDYTLLNVYGYTEKNVQYNDLARYQQLPLGYTFEKAVLSRPGSEQLVQSKDQIIMDKVFIQDNDNTIKVYYIENDTIITDSTFTKEREDSNSVIALDDNLAKYVLTYNAKIENLVGDATVVITDEIPMSGQILTTNEEIEASIKASLDSDDEVICSTENGKLECTITYKNINTYTDGEKVINFKIPFEVKYDSLLEGNFTEEITNVADVVLSVKDKKDSDKLDHDSVVVDKKQDDDTVKVVGSIIVEHIYGSEKVTSYKNTTNVGTSIDINKVKPQEKDGYVYKTVSSNNESTKFTEGNLTEGKYMVGTTKITYTYVKEDIKVTDPEGEKGFTKDGTDKIYSVNDVVDYTITYKKNIENHIGDYKLVITDKLPYEGEVTFTNDTGKNNCKFDDNTITCTFEEKDINTYETGVYEIDVEIPVTIKYTNIDGETTNKITNKAIADLILVDRKDPEIPEEKPIDPEAGEKETEIYGKVVVKHVYGSQEIETYNKTELVGTDIPTQEPQPKDGYIYEKVTSTSENNKFDETGKLIEGSFISGETEITYTYVKEDIEIPEDAEFVKEGNDIITSVDEELNYTITYKNSIMNHIGDVKLVITDKLPYEGEVTLGTIEDDRISCEVSNNTITCIYEEKDINTYENGIYEIDVEIPFSITYSGVEADYGTVITNKAIADLILVDRKDPEVPEEKPVDPEETEKDTIVDVKGTVTVYYVDSNGNILEKEVLTDNVGLDYETIAKDFDGYTYKGSEGMTNGKYVDGNIDVYYYYEQIIVPPHTGTPNNNDYIILFLLAMLTMLGIELSLKKRESL